MSTPRLYTSLPAWLKRYYDKYNEENPEAPIKISALLQPPLIEFLHKKGTITDADISKHAPKHRIAQKIEEQTTMYRT